MSMKFFFDLLPILLFFITFKLTDHNIYAATGVAMAATLGQIIWSKYKHNKVDKILWISFVIVGLLGGATLLFHNEMFIKLKPSVLYWLFSLILFIAKFFFHKNLIRSLLHEKITLPFHVWKQLNYAWSGFFFFLGFANLYVAFNYSTDTWVDFKLFGFTALMFIFVVIQGMWLVKYLDEKKEEN